MRAPAATGFAWQFRCLAGLPDPLILSFYFSLREARITQLIILHNKALA